MLSIPVLVSTSRGTPADLETEQYPLRIVDRVVFHKPVLNSRVNAIARNGEGLPIRADVEHIVVERVGAVEVGGLAQRVCLRIAEARDIAQSRIAGQADGFEFPPRFCVGNAVGELLSPARSCGSRSGPDRLRRAGRKRSRSNTAL